MRHPATVDEHMDMKRLELKHQRGITSILIGRGTCSMLGEILDQGMDPEGERGLFLGIDRQVAGALGDRFEEGLTDQQDRTTVAAFDASEANKVPGMAIAMYDSMLEAMESGMLDRRGICIAAGGGITTDLVGYAAATFLRGLDLVLVPTSLLGMVDAAIGGKTAVNLSISDDRIGKNLVGTIWQPELIIIDADLLETLPDRELRCGLAECIKHGLISDVSILEDIEANPGAITERDPGFMDSLILRCIQVKLDVVESDEREEGNRATLNFGHTFAHAFESCPQLELAHGEAVAIGMVAAWHLGQSMGTIEQGLLARVRDAIAGVGLPVALEGEPGAMELLELMKMDKKVRQGTPRFVLPTRLGQVDIFDDIPEQRVIEALASVGARA